MPGSIASRIGRLERPDCRIHGFSLDGILATNYKLRTLFDERKLNTSMRLCRIAAVASILLSLAAGVGAQGRRKVIIDQDARGPATTDQQAILMLVQSADVEPLGITVVSGDQWRDEEVLHTLRTLETVGRADIPVVPGAIFPLINSKEEIARWETLYGKVNYQGAWDRQKRPISGNNSNRDKYYGPFEIPPMPEGMPTTKPLDEDAAHFIIRMVHKYPGEVTIYAGGPLTNLALAIAIDPKVAELAQELVVMGGSLNPAVDPEWAMSNRREFNFWWDPEATHMVLRAPWKKVTVTTVDISVKTRLTRAMIAEISKSPAPAAQYIAKYADEEYMWDELAAASWLEPDIITKEQMVYMDMDISHTAGYGNTLTWESGAQPGMGEQLVHMPLDLDAQKFYQLFEKLMMQETPGSHLVRGDK